jgi:hypothetical protein
MSWKNTGKLKPTKRNHFLVYRKQRKRKSCVKDQIGSKVINFGGTFERKSRL